MSTQQYKDIDPDDNCKNDDINNSWKQNQSIELDVQTLSVNKIHFLKSFIENPHIQNMFNMML